MTAGLADPGLQDGPDGTNRPDGTDHPQGTDGTAAPGRPRGRLAGTARRWRMPLGILALFIAGVIVIVILAPRSLSNSYLDPASKSDDGTRALTDILGDRGFHVASVYSPAAALAALAASTPATLVITSPALLTPAQRAQLGQAHADLVLIEPGSAALRVFAPAVRVASAHAGLGHAVDPSCDLAGARLAGSADTGGITYQIAGYMTGCYPVDGSPSVVRYERAGHSVTILGSGGPLTNGLLALAGNAALSLNLLSAHRTIVWLTPEPKIARPVPARAGNRPPPLIPAAAWLVVLQLVFGLVLTIIWRTRRLGPLITEHLPVVVRASETVEGHARLYQSRRARDRAAGALRAAKISQLRPALGLAADAPADAVIDALASRSGRTREQIAAIVSGSAPPGDADLVRLAQDLDELEREVRAQ